MSDLAAFESEFGHSLLQAVLSLLARRALPEVAPLEDCLDKDTRVKN